MANLDDILRGLVSGRTPNSGLVTSRIPQAGRAAAYGQQRDPVRDNQSSMSAAEYWEQRDRTPIDNGGSGGSSVWGNIGGAVLKGLNVLDMPRRAIVSGLKEGLDAVGITDGDASWSDFKQQFDDPTFGFGTITGDVTGNKWVDRAIGFAGDVLLDPLTYVTGGANAGVRKGMSAAGRQGRFATAGRAALQGADDATVAAIGRLGGSAVSDAAQREAYGLGQRGLRFMGQRIAGTGGIDRAIGNTMARGRNAVTSSDWWTKISRKPEGLEGVYKTLQQGAGPMRPTEAATVLAYVNARQAGKNKFFRGYESTAKGLFDGMDEQQRVALTHATERGDATAFGKVLTQIREDLVGRGARIGSIEMERQGVAYVPHVWTRRAWDWLKGDSADAVEFRKAVGIDLTAGPTVAMERVFKGGKYKFNGVDVDFGSGSIVDINNAMRKAFGGGPEKFLEDDAQLLMARYMGQASEASGVLDAVKRLRESNLSTVSEDAFDFIPDEDLMKIRNKELRDVFTARKKEVQAQQKSLLRETAEAAANVRLSLSDDVLLFADRQDAVGAKIRQMIGNWSKDQSPQKQLATFKKAYSELRDGFEKQAAAAQSAVDRLEKQASDLRAKAAVTGPDVVQGRLEKVAKQLASEKTRLQKIREDQRMLPRLLAEQARLEGEIDNLALIARSPEVAAQAFADANPDRLLPQILDADNVFVPPNSYSARADMLDGEIDALEDALSRPQPSQSAADTAASIREGIARGQESLRLANDARDAAFADVRSMLSEYGITNGFLSGPMSSGQVVTANVVELFENFNRANPFLLPEEVLKKRNDVIRRLANATRGRNKAAASFDEARRSADDAAEAFLDRVVDDDLFGRTVRELLDDERIKRQRAIENSPERLTQHLVKVQGEIDRIDREIARLDSLAAKPSVAKADVLYPIRRTKEASERAYQRMLDSRPKNRDLDEWMRYYQQRLDELTDRSIQLMDDAQRTLWMIDMGNIDATMLSHVRRGLGLPSNPRDPRFFQAPQTQAGATKKMAAGKKAEQLAAAKETVAAIREELDAVYQVLPEDVSVALETFAGYSKEARKIDTHLSLLERQLGRYDELAVASVEIDPALFGQPRTAKTSGVLTVAEARRQLDGLRETVRTMRKLEKGYQPRTIRRSTDQHVRWRARRAAVARAEQAAKGVKGDSPIALGAATEAGTPLKSSPLDFRAERQALAQKSREIAKGVPTDADAATLPELWREMDSVAKLNDELFGKRAVSGLTGADRVAADAANAQRDALVEAIDTMPFTNGSRRTAIIRSLNSVLDDSLVTEQMLDRVPAEVASRWQQLKGQLADRVLSGRAVGTGGAVAPIDFGANPRMLPAEQAHRNLAARIKTLGVIRERLLSEAKEKVAKYNIADPRAARDPQWDDWFAYYSERLQDIDSQIGGAEKAARGSLHDLYDEAGRLAKLNQQTNSRLADVRDMDELVEASVIGAAIARVNAAIDQGLLPTDAAGAVTEEAFDTAFQRALARSSEDVRKYYDGLAKQDADMLGVSRRVADGKVVELSEKQVKELRRQIDDQMHAIAARMHDVKRREEAHRAIFKEIEQKTAARGSASAGDMHLVVDKDDPIVIVGASAPTLDDKGRMVVVDANGKKWVLGDDVTVTENDTLGGLVVKYREDTKVRRQREDWMANAVDDNALPATRTGSEIVDTGGAPIEFVDDFWLRRVGYAEIRQETAAAVDTAAAEIKTILGDSITWDRARDVARRMQNTRSSYAEAAKLWDDFLKPENLGKSVRSFEQRMARNRSRAAYAQGVARQTSQVTPDGTINSWRNALGFDTVDPVSRYQVAAKRREGLREFIREMGDRLPAAQKELNSVSRRIELAQGGEADRLATRVQQAEFDPYSLIETPESLNRAAQQAESGVEDQISRFVAATEAVARVDELEAAGLARFDRAAQARESANRLWTDRAKAREEVAKGLRAKAKAVKTAPKQFKNSQAARDFGDIVTGLGREVQKNGLNNWSVRTYGLLDEYEGMLKQVKASENDLLFFDSLIEAADQQRLAAPVFKRVYRDGFEQLGPDLLGDAGPQVTSAVADALRNFERSLDNGEFMKYLAYANRFFKTYATLTPGFHVRNMMSAGFMNFSDGVGLRDHMDAFRIWGDIRRGGKQAMESLGDEERLALEATFGSGVAGRFGVEEIGAREGAFKLERKALDNWAVRASRSAGENYVEGPIRFAAALAAVRGGANLDQAIGRIARLHFDYSELSKFDRAAKQLVPFYVFASRNAPLQIQQMLTRPKAYAIYRNFVNNFAQDEENDIVPKWIRERMGFIGARDVGLFGGNDIALTPDLPFVNLAEDVSKFNPLDPKRALTDFTPFLKVPLETMLFDKNLFFDQPFYGGTPEKLSYAARSIAPPLAQAQRLLGLGDRYSGREAQSWANYLGIPVRELSPQVIEAEMRRRTREN